MTEENKNELHEEEVDNTELPDEEPSVGVEGHIKISDPETGEVFVDKRNAIHYENFSESLASMIGNKGTGFIHEMHFGNGGTSVDPTGFITYLPSNNAGVSADLYNSTFSKVVDDTSSLNTDPVRNKMEIRHVTGQVYTDILVTCLLDFGEPSGQQAFDDSSSLDDQYVFDELGLKSWEGGSEAGNLLTHVVFHPVQKALNRLMQIDYTIRVRTLTNLGTIT